MKISCFRDK